MIEVNNLSKSFCYYEKEMGLKSSVRNIFLRKKLIKEAVKDISFHIDAGECVGFLGPNGAGKTTTLKMLSGILYPSSGDIFVNGFLPYEKKKEFKRQFAIVMGQKSQLWWDLPASESFYLNKCIYEIDDKKYKKTLESLTEMLDVSDLLKIQVRRLSLGERMKMELIAALIHSPQILFLDEPTIGLDIISQRKIREFLKELNEEFKTTIILTSHYMNDIEELCKRSIVINQGKLVYDGELSKVNELFNQKKLIKLQFEKPVEETQLQILGKVRTFDGMKAVIELPKQYVKNYSLKGFADLPVIDMNIEDIPIEEGIALLYKKENVVNE